ncbi:MAG: hypothetical protein LBN27_07165 [Prevotellaceae bacterium]|jgi:hypothetical protein|nr:hypothetical protein [Prevotellaceae bacterium]
MIGINKNKKYINKIGTLFLFLLLSVQAFSQASISWEIPFVKISYSLSNGFSISANAGIPTPIGKFSVEYTQSLYDKRKSSEIVYVDRITIQKQDLLVVFRNRNKNSEQDMIYKIKDGANLDATTDGKTNIIVREGIIIVDITSVENCDVVFNSKENGNQQNINTFPNKEKIIKFINDYYKYLKNNQFQEASNLFAYRLKRFHSTYNISRESVIEKIKQYDNTFGVYNKKFNVHWESLELTNIGNKYVSISYTLDYFIERSNKNKPSTFLIEMNIELNNNYQIISIYENILNKK